MTFRGKFSSRPSIPGRFPQPKALFCDFAATQKQPPTSACLVASGRHSDHPFTCHFAPSGHSERPASAHPHHLLPYAVGACQPHQQRHPHPPGGVSGGQPAPRGLGRFPTQPPRPCQVCRFSLIYLSPSQNPFLPSSAQLFSKAELNLTPFRILSEGHVFQPVTSRLEPSSKSVFTGLCTGSQRSTCALHPPRADSQPSQACLWLHWFSGEDGS